VEDKGARKRRENVERFFLDWSDDVEDDLEDDDDDAEDIDWENTANDITHKNSKATLRTSSSKPQPPSPSDRQQEETPTFITPVIERGEAASLDPGLQEPSSLWTESEKTDTVPRVDDLTQVQLEKERNETASAVSDTPESSMSAEQRIKQLEEKVAELNALRLVDAASISRSSPYPLSLKKKQNLIFNRVNEEGRHSIR
jgi:hypothetical protein